MLTLYYKYGKELQEKDFIIKQKFKQKKTTNGVNVRKNEKKTQETRNEGGSSVCIKYSHTKLSNFPLTWRKNPHM